MIANAVEISSSEVKKITSTINATLEQKAMVTKHRLMERLPGIEQATYTINAPVLSEASLTIKPLVEIKPEDPEGNPVDISAPQTPTQQDESPPAFQQIEKPILTSEFVKKVLFDNKALISQVETRWFLDHPIVAKELQQIKWHKKLVIFTNPDEPDSSKRLNLTTYKSLWLKILRFQEMGIDNFLKPGAEWNRDSKDVLDFWNKGKRNVKAIGIKVGDSTPCEYLGRVLNSLGLRTQFKQIDKVRFYQVAKPDPINLAIYKAVGQRLEAELLEKKSSVNWDLISSSGTQSIKGLHPAHLPQDLYNKNQQGALEISLQTTAQILSDNTSDLLSKNQLSIPEDSSETISEIPAIQVSTLANETQSVEGLQATHLPEDFYNKNQQGVFKAEEKTNTFAVTVSQTWRGSTLKLRQGIKDVTNCANSLYQDLVGRFAAQQGKAESEPFWNGYLAKWVVPIVFPSGCRSIPCEWLDKLPN